MTDRYSCPPIAELFSREAFVQRWIEIESVASAAVGHGPFHAGDIDFHFVLGQSAQLEAVYGHDVAAFVEALRQDLRLHADYATLPGGRNPAHWLHYGLCSSDVVDSAWTLQIRRAARVLYDLAQSAREELYALPDYIELDARTHGQSAKATHLGAIKTGWISRLERARDGVATHTPRHGGGFQGPTGLKAVFPIDVSMNICDELGFDFAATSGQANPRDEYARWVHEVAMLASACEHVALQIRLWSQSGLAVVEEGHASTDLGAYRGSSSMPHKRNPTRSERICGLATIVRALSAGYTEAAASWWGEHSLEHSSVDRVVIPQVVELTGFILTELADLLHGSAWDDAAGKAVRAHAAPDSYSARNYAVEAGVDPGIAYEEARKDRR